MRNRFRIRKVIGKMVPRDISLTGLGATAIPGFFAIVPAQGSGHLHYVVANALALTIGAVLTAAYLKVKKPIMD